VVGVVAAGLVLAVVVAAAVVSGGDGARPRSDGELDDEEAASASEVLAMFEAGEPLGDMNAASVELAEAAVAGEPQAAAACAAAVDRLDGIGTPAELAEAASGIGHLEVTEAALEQQAGVMSVLAACRGEAPVSATEAAEELAMSNAALDGLLGELSEGSD